ncbi:unnamed protein product [Phytophthora fragariaefolia]|uniref:Unnamed protein product n=1 Tax=Phytophthora fragariaefolia TaxID=1490495 RepID=A0A9W6TV04_9STRA|nr:unnamed protein product [Phytophthora fragariaefolia]
MSKSDVKTKKAPRATEATPKDASPSAEESSPKETTPQRANGATSADSESHAKKGSPTKAQALATATAPSAKTTRRTRASKRKEVRLPGPYVEPAPSDDSQDLKSSANTTPPAKAPQERSPPPEDGPDPVDYEELEPDQDRDQGEVPDPNSSPQLTEQQRVTHPGGPMTPKSAAAVARVEAQAQSESSGDTAPTDMPEQQIITNAGIDEGGSTGTTAARQPKTSQ